MEETKGCSAIQSALKVNVDHFFLIGYLYIVDPRQTGDPGVVYDHI
jgi:hypothetical protein